MKTNGTRRLRVNVSGDDKRRQIASISDSNDYTMSLILVHKKRMDEKEKKELLAH